MSKGKSVGDRNEDWVMSYYRHKGYSVWAPPKPSWSKTGIDRTRDVWGVFDVMASSDKDMVFAQVKTECTFRSGVEKGIKEFICPSNVIKEYWTFRGDYAQVRAYRGDRMLSEYKVDFLEWKNEKE